MKNDINIKRAMESDFTEMQKLFRKIFDILGNDQNVEYPYTESGAIP